MNTPNTINDGGEAFPSNGYPHLHRPGMSLRAYFAGQALTGIIQAATNAHYTRNASSPDEVLAKWAVEIADALIAELNKTQ
jgi:hypothetical protein